MIDAVEIQKLNSFFRLPSHPVVRCPAVAQQKWPGRLATFVERGGGRVGVAWANAVNENSTTLGQSIRQRRTLLPMKLLERTVGDPSQVTNRCNSTFDSVSHVTLDPLLETGQHDLSELQVSALIGSLAIGQLVSHRMSPRG